MLELMVPGECGETVPMCSRGIAPKKNSVFNLILVQSQQALLTVFLNQIWLAILYMQFLRPGKHEVMALSTFIYTC